jgi:murein DD-endopeptidase MepM/ murein hydrolase activator NlpD
VGSPLPKKTPQSPKARALVAFAAVSPLVSLAVLLLALALKSPAETDLSETFPPVSGRIEITPYSVQAALPRGPVDLEPAPLAATDESISEAMRQANRTIEKTPPLSFLPVAAETDEPKLIWPISSTFITSEFGRRDDPIHGLRRGHLGVDVRADEGTPVLAVAPGQVEVADYSSRTGLYVRIDHGNQVYTRYAHLSELLVNPGEAVTAGQVIGRSGATGRVTGPHLHFEVTEAGRPQDPLTYDWKIVTPRTSFEEQAMLDRGVDVSELGYVSGSM